MTTPRELRPYQSEAVNAVLTHWGTPGNDVYTPVVVLPTGTGKSTVIAKLAEISAREGLRVALMAHRQELLNQMAESVAVVAPDLPPVEFVQGLRQTANDDTSIIAASFQTLAASPDRWPGRLPDVVLVDEMHHSTAPTYKEVLDRFGLTNHTGDSPIFACGFTATAQRSDGGLSEIWQEVVYEKSLTWAIEQGYLVRPRGLTVVVPTLDLTNVTIRGGDYAAGELETAMQASVDSTVRAVHTHAPDRCHIVFAAGVDHAESLASKLSETGIMARAVTGAMSTDEREAVYTLFHSGAIQTLVTVQVLTEGADFPRCDCVVMARPTRSQVLYTQMVGRCVRLYPGKVDALVLDVAGTTRDMSLKTVSSLDAALETKRVSPTSDMDPGQDEPAAKIERVQREGELELEEIDLLTNSPFRWLSTRKGVKFLDCGSGLLVFLWPPNPSENDMVAVGLSHAPALSTDGFSDPMTLEAALSFADEAAARMGNPPRVDAAWRKRSKPSDGQVRFARSLGISTPELKTRARLSNDISVILASKRLDRFE